MKFLFICCAVCCFIAIVKLPIEYYTFLRIIVSISATLAIYHFIKLKNITLIVVFTIILFLFNPVFPFYMYKKSIWIPFDIITGILFLVVFFLKKKIVVKEKGIKSLPLKKTYIRDRIILPKTKN
ncbi:hypothetical protein DU508_22320 [Pedobacter chinensis]|uniref:Uncharacterized protein n=1 Tax=Pedobacter chinensis TaxID=2282421 RepID=A0A369PVS8_9SPHI|nr:hypothetical protein DU508_22320 [Pedobacter chinensis]